MTWGYIPEHMVEYDTTMPDGYEPYMADSNWHHMAETMEPPQEN